MTEAPEVFKLRNAPKTKKSKVKKVFDECSANTILLYVRLGIVTLLIAVSSALLVTHNITGDNWIQITQAFLNAALLGG
jgi:hypothetical protein